MPSKRPSSRARACAGTISVVIPQKGTIVRGGESSALGLARFLQAKYDVTVIGARKTDAVPWQPVPFIDPSPRALSLYNASPLWIRRLLSRMHLDPEEYQTLRFCVRGLLRIMRQPPQLLQVRSVGFWGGIFGRVLGWLRGVPFVSITGGWKMSEYEHAKLRPNTHISVNPEVADYLRQRLPDVPVEYLPNGLDVADFKQETRPVDIDLERPLFLAAGAILPYKRYHLIFRAVAGLDRGSLLILGEGDEDLTSIRK